MRHPAINTKVWKVTLLEIYSSHHFLWLSFIPWGEGTMLNMNTIAMWRVQQSKQMRNSIEKYSLNDLTGEDCWWRFELQVAPYHQPEHLLPLFSKSKIRIMECNSLSKCPVSLWLLRFHGAVSGLQRMNQTSWPCFHLRCRKTDEPYQINNHASL